MWKVKHFSELSNDELLDIMHLRNEVFVVEQKRLYQEIDKMDKKALHLFKLDEDHDLVAYARIFLGDDGETVSFGRVVTSKKVRGQGVGQELVKHILDAIRHYYPGHLIEIEAQTYVQQFYEKYGFQTRGKAFIFSLTPHIKMVHQPLN